MSKSRLTILAARFRRRLPSYGRPARPADSTARTLADATGPRPNARHPALVRLRGGSAGALVAPAPVHTGGTEGHGPRRKPDRRVRAGQARREGADAVNSGCPPPAHPPTHVRPARPATDPGRDPGVPR